MKTVYTAHASAVGGRDGSAATDDKNIDVKIVRPGNPGGTNPEQLFAVGYAACFGGATQYLAQQRKLETGPIEVKSHVSLNQDDSGFSIGVVLDVQLPGMDSAAAHELVKAAHQFCPYSKATRGNVDVQLMVNGQPLV